MKSVKTKQNNLTLKAPVGEEDNVYDLNVTKLITTDGRKLVESCWLVNKEEATEILDKGRLYFTCWGETHPPILLSVNSFVDDNEPIETHIEEPEKPKRFIGEPYLRLYIESKEARLNLINYRMSNFDMGEATWSNLNKEKNHIEVDLKLVKKNYKDLYGDIRPSRDEVFMNMTHELARRSVCKRLHVGAMVVLEGRPISVGYNGPPRGFDHCIECDGESCGISVHAEINAIAFSARNGVNVQGSTLYCTDSPCISCAKAIISAGIVEVVYDRPYRLTNGVELLEKAGIRVIEYSNR